MHLYRFFNPSAVGADKYVVYVAATSKKAINAYVDMFYPNSSGVFLSKDFNRDGVITMEVSLKKLNDGRIIFCKIFAIDIF